MMTLIASVITHTLVIKFLGKIKKELFLGRSQIIKVRERSYLLSPICFIFEVTSLWEKSERLSWRSEESKNKKFCLFQWQAMWQEPGFYSIISSGKKYRFLRILTKF